VEYRGKARHPGKTNVWRRNRLEERAAIDKQLAASFVCGSIPPYTYIYIYLSLHARIMMCERGRHSFCNFFI
jgi:hypothetical protein